MYPQGGIEEIVNTAPVIPVVIIDDAEDAVPLANALVAGGLPVIEVTLRTPAAIEAISQIKQNVPAAIVGAGTVLGWQQVDAVMEAGAAFAVSPGATDTLLNACAQKGLALLPGAATASESMQLLESGYRFQKCFPAEQVGGVAYLKSLSSPLPDVQFCPTGGVKSSTAPDYLALPNVVCVGGSWITPKDAVSAKDWGRIEALAADAAKLKG